MTARTRSSAARAESIDSNAVLEVLRANQAGIGAAALASAASIDHVVLRERLKAWEAEGMVRRTGRTKATLWHLVGPEGAPAPESTSASPTKGKRKAQRRLVRPEPSPPPAEAAPKGGAKSGRARKVPAPPLPVKKARGTKAPRAQQTPPTLHVWRVRTATERTVYVVGATIADAAAAAHGALGMDVVGVEFLGDLVA